MGVEKLFGWSLEGHPAHRFAGVDLDDRVQVRFAFPFVDKGVNSDIVVVSHLAYLFDEWFCVRDVFVEGPGGRFACEGTSIGPIRLIFEKSDPDQFSSIPLGAKVADSFNPRLSD